MATASPISTSRSSIEFHRSHGKLATVTGGAPARAVRQPRTRRTPVVTGFTEKPQGDGGWINGGFFVLSPRASTTDRRRFHRLGAGAARATGPKRTNCVSFVMKGFWQPMDTSAGTQSARRALEGGQAAVADVGTNPEFWRGRRVLVTGHTGFKGAWLSLWLSAMNARVFGFSLAPPTTPSLVRPGRVAAVVDDTRGDIRDIGASVACVATSRPEVVFHLAAQSRPAQILCRSDRHDLDQRDGYGEPARGGASVQSQGKGGGDG